MRAFVLPEQGAAPQIRELDVPEPGAGEIRVRVHAASVNGFDLSVAHGSLVGLMEHRFPVVLGKDFAGTVDAVGPDASGYSAGDRVFGVVTKPFVGDGSFAEYVTVPTVVGVAPLPPDIGFTEGAALGLAGSAAVAAVESAQPGAGQTVLVAGATGGVGNVAVQLATATGARVIATASTPAEQSLVGALGAQETVDHTQDLAGAVRALAPEGVDAVLHLAGDPATLLGLVRAGGRFVSTLVSPDQLAADSVTVVPVYANPEPALLTRLASGLESGTRRVVVQQTFPLERAADALAAFAAGTLGKLVITLD